MNHNDRNPRALNAERVHTIGRTTSPRWVRSIALVAAAVLMIGLVAGCGDDDDTSTEDATTEDATTEETSTDDGTSSEDAFCAAGDSLESNIDGLGDIDIVAEGTDALDAQFDAITSDLADLRSSGREVAADEIAALESSVDQLEADLDALGGEVTAEGASAVRESVNSVVTAAQTVLDTLDATCP